MGVNLLDDKLVESRPALFGECFTHNAVNLSDPVASLRWRWLIERKWKLIVPHSPNEPDGRIELFDLGADSNETTNLAKENPEVKRMGAQLDAWWKPGT